MTTTTENSIQTTQLAGELSPLGPQLPIHPDRLAEQASDTAWKTRRATIQSQLGLTTTEALKTVELPAGPEATHTDPHQQ